MDAEVATGGIFLLVIVIGFVVVVGLIAAATVSGFNKVEDFDRRRAMERNMRRQAQDANQQQRIARKLLDEYKS